MEVIEDLEAARTALGYERINLLSESYGTRVAYLYGVKHPDSIHRSAMIGVNPPGRLHWEPATIDAQLWGPLSLASWPVKPIPEEYRKMQHSDVQTLLISGSVDFSTPAEFATKELLPYLRNGHQVILSEIGHVNDVWKIIPATTERLLTSFYNTGVPNTSLATYTAMDFNVKWGFPTTAKALLGIMVVAAVIIAGLAWLLISTRQLIDMLI